ncbi:hypothetical protein G7054_g5701 [Neopestalotiopsis clavispora]|nr:hypothetical protein G7054_g5701 [Neopestalotiopsis clavispora]
MYPLLHVAYRANAGNIKSSFYDPSTAYDDQGILPDPFILKDEELYSRMKRNSANAYSLSSVVQLEGYVDDTIQKLFQQLDQQAKSGDAVVDLGRLFVHFAMDAIFNITFGQTLDFLDSKDGSGMLTALEKMIAYTGTIGQMPWLHKYLLGNPVMNRLWIGEMGFERGLIQLATARVKQFRDSLSKRDPDMDASCTFTERLLLNQASSPKMLTDREIEVHAFGNITAGSDTTSIALRAIFYFLLKYPETYVKLCEEVREIGVYPVKYHDAHKLPYLGAVIKEAMRLHPSMAIMLGRTVPAGGATVCGHYLPEGTEVGISAWVVHRDPQIFPEPHKFRPERWLTQDQDLKARMNRAFFTFGAGTHTCSGRHISMMEIEKVVPDMLLKYDIELAYPDREWTFSNRMFTPQEGVLVKLRKRH